MEFKLYIWQKILGLLYEEKKLTESDIHIKTGMTYSHVCKVLSDLNKLGFVSFNKVGRTKEISLTPSGEELANHCYRMIIILEKSMKITIEPLG